MKDLALHLGAGRDRIASFGPGDDCMAERSTTTASYDADVIRDRLGAYSARRVIAASTPVARIIGKAQAQSDIMRTLVAASTNEIASKRETP